MTEEKEDTGELSAEQKARSSQNFRAAKALLARKRPRHTSLATPHTKANNENIRKVTMGDDVKRAPLSEIPMNTPSPVSRKKGSKIVDLVDVDCYSELCSKDFSINGTNTNISFGISKDLQSPSFDTPVAEKEFNSRLCSNGASCKAPELVDACLSERGRSLHIEVGVGPNSFTTPVRLSGCSISSEPVTSSSTLDDDFDESILEQIDVLCKQKSAAKSEREAEHSTQLENQHVKKEIGECETDGIHALENQLEAECSSRPDVVKECREGESRNSKETKTESMPEDYKKYIHSLNEKQQEAACNDISIPLMIIAGPGSGKTSTMVGRVLMLMSEGIDPSHILAMTFTTAAVSEMRERIGTIAGKAAAKELTISTFHSFSLQLCRSHAEKLGRTPDFLIYGNGQQRKAITEAVRLMEDGRKMPSHELYEFDRVSGLNSLKYFKDKSKKWLKFIAKAKAAGRTPEDFQRTGNDMEDAILCNYNDILKSCNALDYNDLISCSVKLLTDFPEVFKECQEAWKAIVIDEFQDTSAMQYDLLRILASHKCITVIGDDDQSIFSFNGADVSGFDSFRKDFPQHKEVRLNKNYRSTRCIVEAASHLIQNNLKRCKSKSVHTDNSSGSKITVRECCNEAAQCAFVVDKILEISSDGSSDKCSFGNIAVLYRRQVSGKIFQTAFRNRKIPFNMHGAAFYMKKVVRAIIAMLKTTLPGCDDGPFRRAFKALLPSDKEEKKKVIEHIDKVSTVRKCSFISAAYDIFSAKISGTFKRSQLTQGRKVLLTLDMIDKLVHREQSISAVITSVANMMPQKYLIEQRAILDVDGGKLLNEDNDLRSVLQYLLDDVSDFITTQEVAVEEKSSCMTEEKDCHIVLKAFIDYISEREAENFRCRRHDNEDSVTLTTIHQSKGLEWDTVFIVKANESEIPLLHEYNGSIVENGTSIEEERRLLYVAMTRARKNLYILYLTMDTNWQVLQPSRFLREIPRHLLDTQDELDSRNLLAKQEQIPQANFQSTVNGLRSIVFNDDGTLANTSADNKCVEDPDGSTEAFEIFNGNNFLRRFNSENRAVISHLFHQWAKKPAFQEPKRLLDKVAFVIDERLRVKKTTHKDVLRTLKACLRCDDAFHYAKTVLQWEQMPADKRAYLMREKQEHFQKLRMENAMGSSAPTTKQIAFLQNLGCTVVPASRLHASRLIEEYKSL